MKKLLGLLFFFTASFSHANPDWFEKGNGRFAVVCPGTELQTVPANTPSPKKDY